MKLAIRIFGLCAIVATGMQAASFSFVGQFTADDQVQLFNFNISSPTNVVLLSQGFGGGIFPGGTNSGGTVVMPGGFDSLLTWFDGAATFVGSNDDDTSSTVNIYHGSRSDALFNGTLDAGSYTLALTQHGNTAVTNDLTDGFSQTGNPEFTCGTGLGSFCDGSGGTTTGNWAIDILGVDSASVSAAPEPGTVLLLAVPLVLVAIARRRLA